MSFHDIAAPLAARFGVRMIPIPFGGKGPVWTGWIEEASATPSGIADLERRCLEDKRYDRWNAGVVADPTISCALDCDEPGLPERIERETGQKLPATFTVRSGGKGSPHYYFRPTSRSTAIGNRSTGFFDFWVSRHQTVAPGSTHASGRLYEVIDNSDLATIPNWLCDWIGRQESIWRAKTGVSDDSAIGRLGAAYRRHLNPEDMYALEGLQIDAGQHPTMLYLAGLLHDGERTADDITAILVHLWATYCAGRDVNVEEMERIAQHVVKGEPASFEPTDLPSYAVGKVLFATREALGEYLATRDLRSDGVVAYPYPLAVWEGTLYEEFANLCSAGNFIPREFFIESLKTVVGAVLGRNLLVDKIEGAVPRFDTVLIGPPSCGKNTAVDWSLSVFKTDQVYVGAITGAEEGRYLWPAQETCSTTGLGACRTRISSASGLSKFLPTSTGKSQNVPQDRLLLVYTELTELLEKAGIDGSGASLVGAICDLYDGEDFAVPALKDQRPFGGKLLLSLLGGIQPDRWNDHGSGKGVENSGIHSRWNLIPNESLNSVAYLERPDFREFAKKLFPLLPTTPLTLTVTAAAKAEMGRWYADMIAQAAQSYADSAATRLNILAWRNAMHHAWILGKAEIDVESVQAGAALSNYQFTVRGQYTPLIGDSPIAKYMNRMRRVLEKNKLMPVRAFRKAVNYQRMGDGFDRAFRCLAGAGEVEMVNDNGTESVSWSGGGE